MLVVTMVSKKTKPIFHSKQRGPSRISIVSKKTKLIDRKQQRPTVSKEEPDREFTRPTHLPSDTKLLRK